MQTFSQISKRNLYDGMLDWQMMKTRQITSSHQKEERKHRKSIKSFVMGVLP